MNSSVAKAMHTRKAK